MKSSTIIKIALFISLMSIYSICTWLFYKYVKSEFIKFQIAFWLGVFWHISMKWYQRLKFIDKS